MALTHTYPYVFACGLTDGVEVAAIDAICIVANDQGDGCANEKQRERDFTTELGVALHCSLSGERGMCVGKGRDRHTEEFV